MVTKDETTPGKKSSFPVIVGIFAIVGCGIIGCIIMLSSGTGGSSLQECKGLNDPVAQMICLNQFCAFDTSKCQVSCPLGNKMDEKGCPVSCECATSGLHQLDERFAEQDVPTLLNQYTATPDKAPSNSRTSQFSVFPRSASSNKDHLWLSMKRDGVVSIPFKFKDQFSQKSKETIKKGMSMFKDNTCIEFVPYDDNNIVHKTSHVVFVDKEGCWAHVGKLKHTGTEVSLGNDCITSDIVAHELMHVLGFYHEHTRPDRDGYVTINLDNVKSGMKHHFNKMASSQIQSLDTPYDVKSIMQFDGFSGSKDGVSPTIIDKATGEPLVAQRNGLSETDIREIIEAYECKTKNQLNAAGIAIRSGSADATSKGVSWSSWQAWSPPDVTCGLATMKRVRYCYEDASQTFTTGCPGNAGETKTEEQESCSNGATGKWGEWQPFSLCSKQCGGGISWSYRHCTGGNQQCIGNSAYGVQCNTHSCDKSGSRWSPWSSWSECTKPTTCDTSFQYIVTHCKLPSGELSTDCGKSNLDSKYITIPCDKNCQPISEEQIRVNEEIGSQISKPGADNVPPAGTTGSPLTGSAAGRLMDQSSSTSSGRESRLYAMNIVSECVEEDYGGFCLDEKYPRICPLVGTQPTYGDFNNDGRDDILCSLSSDAFLQYHSSYDRPSMKWKGIIKGCENDDYRYILDINGDGKGDLLCFDPKTRKTTIKYTDHEGIFTDDPQNDLGVICPQEELEYMLPHDGNHDEILDFICALRIPDQIDFMTV